MHIFTVRLTIFAELTRKIKERWQQLGEKERQPFEEKHLKAKERYVAIPQIAVFRHPSAHLP